MKTRAVVSLVLLGISAMVSGGFADEPARGGAAVTSPQERARMRRAMRQERLDVRRSGGAVAAPLPPQTIPRNDVPQAARNRAAEQARMVDQIRQGIAALQGRAGRNQAAMQSRALEQQMNVMLNALSAQAGQNRAGMQSQAVRKQMNLIITALQKQAGRNQALERSIAVRRQMNTVVGSIQQSARVPTGLGGLIPRTSVNQAALQSRMVRGK